MLELNEFQTPLTKELLEQMTEQIYNTVEGDVNTVVNVNVEAGKRVDNRGIKEPAKAEVREKRQRINNPLLRDLIRILILNRILGGKMKKLVFVGVLLLSFVIFPEMTTENIIKYASKVKLNNKEDFDE